MRIHKAMFWSSILFCASFAIFGCASDPKPFMPIGDAITPPAGAVEFCKRVPEDELCA